MVIEASVEGYKWCANILRILLWFFSYPRERYDSKLNQFYYFFIAKRYRRGESIYVIWPRPEFSIVTYAIIRNIYHEQCERTVLLYSGTKVF